MILWPIMAVILALGSGAGIIVVLWGAALALIVVFGALYLLGSGGALGFQGLADHPLVFAPHDAVAVIAAAVAVPLTVWWVRDAHTTWEAADQRRSASKQLEWQLESKLGRLPAGDELEAHLDQHLPEAVTDPLIRRAIVLIRNILVCGAALVLAWKLTNGFWRGAANAPWAGVVLVATMSTLVYLWYRRTELPSQRQPAVLIPAIGAIIAMGFGVVLGIQERSSGTLRDYCEYGAVSRAEVEGCLNHVTDTQIYRLHTDAARFATGALNTCLIDAGPYCASRELARQQSQDAPGPDN